MPWERFQNVSSVALVAGSCVSDPMVTWIALRPGFAPMGSQRTVALVEPTFVTDTPTLEGTPVGVPLADTGSDAAVWLRMPTPVWQK